MDAMVEYNLRPRSSRPRTAKLDSRVAASDRRKEKKAIKVRPAPLSKYRRKTANARERTRMQEINAAFERLQQVVPSFPVASSQDDFSDSSTSTSGNKQLTKITTLRLAMNYIRALSAILEEDKHSTDAEIAARCPPASPPNCEDFDTIDDLMNMSTPSPVLDHDPMLLCDCTDDGIQVDTVQTPDTRLDTQELLSPTDPNCHFDFSLVPDDT